MLALLPLALSPALGADGLDGLDDGLDESAGGGAGRCGRGLLLRPPCDTGLSEVFGRTSATAATVVAAAVAGALWQDRLQERCGGVAAGGNACESDRSGRDGRSDC